MTAMALMSMISAAVVAYGKGPKPVIYGSYRDLDTDLHFWHDYSKDGTGKLYLYSRENPGRRFTSIEFNIMGTDPKITSFQLHNRLVSGD